MPGAVDVFVAGRLARSILALLAWIAVRPDVAVMALALRAAGRNADGQAASSRTV